ncbi:MAG: hypothetical protein K8R02_07085 [Anaerohalosphaeraceae bacterium]|nr:hypothetical protein [Anaerohalosphaeraceae bacterium]
MNLCEKPVIDTHQLLQQISDELCQCFSQGELGILIIDSARDFSAGSFKALDLFGSNRQLFESLCRRIDDGDEPVIVETDCDAVVAAALHTDSTFLGYIFIVLDSSDRQTALAQLDMIEVLIGQAELIAGMLQQKAQAENELDHSGDILSNTMLLSVN